MPKRNKALIVALCSLAAILPTASLLPTAGAIPNPVATNTPTYLAFGRVFPDPQGCRAFGVPDTDGDGIKNTPPGVSPWAKGQVCTDQFLQYQEVVDGTAFLQSQFPDLVELIRLDSKYGNPDYMSAGIPRMLTADGGQPKLLGRDRRPLYLIKVTDKTSAVPEADRQHFAYSLSIHGIERAGIEGGVRAMEDLVTWAACERPDYAELAPACDFEGPFPKRIVETLPNDPSVPTAGAVLKNSVLYFVLANPDGWAKGQVSPVEVEDGSPNVSYAPGFSFQRYNGNGVDINRDWPTQGYTYKPYSPGSEPEVRAFGEVLRGIRETTSAGRFAGGLDLHGMLTAYAFSYTLIGAGQRDYRKNEITVDTAVKTWLDQTKRLSWSPYIGDKNANGKLEEPTERCIDHVAQGGSSGTRGRAPACVADQWGTVIDTLGYQITGGFGDWIDAPMGLDAVGIDNEMYTSHLAPNVIFEPSMEQTHVDGNKGLIMSQVASMQDEPEIVFHPRGKIGYVFDPHRLQVAGSARPPNEQALPPQADIDVLLPCFDPVSPCQGGTSGNDGTAPFFQFTVNGPEDGVWNAGIHATLTRPNVGGNGDGPAITMQLQHFVEGQWQTAATDYKQAGSADAYLPAGKVVTANDPEPGLWRIRLSLPSALPARLQINFEEEGAEASVGQVPIDASSMDFFDELNNYVPEGEKLEAIDIATVVDDPTTLGAYDSIVVVNHLGERPYLVSPAGMALTEEHATQYFTNLKNFAIGGGNLVLTDAALRGLSDLGISTPNTIGTNEVLAPFFNFQLQAGTTPLGDAQTKGGPAPGLISYNDAKRWPLAAGLNLPGTAERVPGARQAVEPAPLGYSPDTGLDNSPRMPNFWVTKSGWEPGCGKTIPLDCTTAATSQNGNNVNLGERRIGHGRIRIAGIMLPDPVFQPDAGNDHRFGVTDYALTYTGWQVFENLINYRRPAGTGTGTTIPI